LLAELAPALADPASPVGAPYRLVVDNTLFLVLLCFPLSLGVAILRYRLWDIGTLINRALVYGLLTGLLAALYAGLVLGLQRLVGLLTGQAAQPVVIVVSTLAIAALVRPLRRRLQALIDRRFYRRKYDAAETLAAFSTTLRHQGVDLEQVSDQLLAVVQETMQPTSLSLWLAPWGSGSRGRGADRSALSAEVSTATSDWFLAKEGAAVKRHGTGRDGAASRSSPARRSGA
jgi:small-conductance mechanosensitive channel